MILYKNYFLIDTKCICQEQTDDKVSNKMNVIHESNKSVNRSRLNFHQQLKSNGCFVTIHSD